MGYKVRMRRNAGRRTFLAPKSSFRVSIKAPASQENCQCNAELYETDSRIELREWQHRDRLLSSRYSEGQSSMTNVGDQPQLTAEHIGRMFSVQPNTI